MARRSSENRRVISSGHESTSGNREMVKFRSPREGYMAANGGVPPHPYPGKPDDHPALVAQGPGIRGLGSPQTTPPNAYGPRRIKEGRQVDNRRLP
jgi:hypothetical protein